MNKKRKKEQRQWRESNRNWWKLAYIKAGIPELEITKRKPT